MNKASGDDEIPADLFQILKRCCESAALSMPADLENLLWPQDWQSQFLFQFQRKAMPKNVQTTMQLHSLHMIARLCSKSFKSGFINVWTKNFRVYKLDLEKAEEQENKLSAFVAPEKARDFQKNSYFFFINYAKDFVWITTNCGKFLKRWEFQTFLPVS